MKKFSSATKILSVVLSLMMIIGSIPIIYTAGAASNDMLSDSSTATKDEAVQTEVPKRTETISKDGTEINFSGKVYFTTNGTNMLYISEGDNKEFTINCQNSKFGSKFNTNKVKIYIYNANEEVDITDRFEITHENKQLIIKVKNSDNYSEIINIMKDGGNDYKLNIFYNDNETPIWTEQRIKYAESPKIDDDKVKYYDINDNEIDINSNDLSEWCKGSIKVSLTVNSGIEDIAAKIKVSAKDEKGSAVNVKENKAIYSFMAENNGVYEITATDELGQSATYKTKQIKIDKTAPIMNYKLYKGSRTATGDQLGDGWSNSIVAEVTLTDPESKVSKDSISVSTNDKTLPQNKLTVNKIDDYNYTVSFEVEERADYKISCKNGAGIELKENNIIEAKSIKLDTKGPEAGDFKLSFKKSENVKDKVLNFLTFGLYSNNDIKVTVSVKDDGLSPISDITLKKSVKTEDGDSNDLVEITSANEITKNEKTYEKTFTLSAEKDSSEVFDLSVSAKDEAGNESGDLRLSEEEINTVISADNVIKDVEKFSKELKEIVISNLAPVFKDNKDDNSLKYEDFNTYNTGKEGESIHISGKGSVSINVEDKITGLYETYAVLDETNNTEYVKNILSESNHDEKTISDTITANFDSTKLNDGEHSVTFYAKGNNGNFNSTKVYFIVDNSAPELDGNFSYSNNENGNWTNENVTVSFKLKDATGINVTCKKSEKTYTVNSNEDKSEYSFIADEYGVYEISAEDSLGNNNNNKKIETEAIRIDKKPPVVKETVEFNPPKETWTNGKVKVTFEVENKPSVDGDLCSEISNVTCKKGETSYQVNWDEKTSEYSFEADGYGEYTITVTDEAGNNSTKNIWVKNIDKIKPTVSSVTFGESTNQKNYGIYHNKALTMKVVVEDVKNDSNVCSDIKSLTLIDKNNGNEKLIEQSVTEDKHTYEYEIENKGKVSDIRNFQFCVTDNAGNTSNIPLTSDLISIDVEDIKDKSIYEVVSTLAKPNIDDISVSFANSKGNVEPVKVGDTKYYSGDGTFTTKITDKVAGIDKYKTYFVNETQLDSSKIKSIDDLENSVGGTSVTEISAKTKVTEKDIEFKSTNKGTLESGVYYAIVVAYNLAGNRSAKYIKVHVDNAPPEVTNVEIKTCEDEGDYTVENRGVYSKKQINISLGLKDGKYSSGIKEVRLYNCDSELEVNKVGEKVGENDITVENVGKFTLKLSNTNYQLKALVIDNNDNRKTMKVEGENKDAPEAINLKTIIVNSNKLMRDPGDPFEIVVNNAPKKIIYTEPLFEFNHSNKNIYKYDDNGYISTTVSNEFSGVESVEVTLDNEILNSNVKQSYEKDKYDKNIKIETTVDIKGLGKGSGIHTILFTATDYCGVEKTLEKTFYIDSTAPTVEKIKFQKQTNLKDQLLNLLTFGLYSNESIEAVVTVKDAGPSSGIKSDSIILKNGDTEIGGIKVNDVDANVEGTTITKTFTLSAGEDEKNSFYNDLKISVEDNFSNTNNDISYEAWSEIEAEGTNIKNWFNNDFEIVATKKVPTIRDFNVTVPKDNYQYTRSDDNTQWYSNNPEITFDVKDETSGIHSVQVNLKNKEYDKDNGIDITKECTYGDKKEKLPEYFIDPVVYSDEKVESIKKITVDQAKMKEGENTVIVTATGNNGVPCEEKNLTFYVDKTAPVVTQFEFSSNSPETKYGENPTAPVNVEKKDYGYFFKDKTTVTVTASDDEGVGVENISFYTVDINGTKSEVKSESAENNSASFEVDAEFKGQIYAYASDFVKNTSDDFNPENVVVETNSQHVKNSYVNITRPATPYKDINGRDLYSSDINVSFEVASKYAGIKTVEYSVISPYDTGNNVTVSSSTNSSGEISGWKVEEKDNNLATVLSKTITVSNNSNDIKVWAKVTDNAGFSTEKEIKFSIDKTSPKIDVKYDVNNPNKVNGEDFYKTDRIATVTVTERNFNKNDFNFKITNTDSVIPQLAAGTNWTSYTPDSTNPDSTVHTATFRFHNDGDYTFECGFKDLSGRSANNYGVDKFTVDQTLPKISVTFDKNGASSYFAEKRTATITIDEHNFYAPYVEIKQNAFAADNSTPTTAPAVSGWSTNGNISTASITFENDGKYSFTVDFKDKAANQAVQAVEKDFYIDTKVDKLEIVNVENMVAYDGSVAPVIRCFDNNYETSDYKLERIAVKGDSVIVDNLSASDSREAGFSRVVSYNNFPAVVENDGIYKLTASIVDRAGNKDQKSILFSVNRFGSTFMLKDNVTKELIQDKHYTNNAPDVVITEINVNEVSKQNLQLNRDDTTQTLKYGTDYTVKHSGGQTSWNEYNYTVLKKNFESEGNYVLTLTSTDHFKNVVGNRTAYKENKIDRTCPVEFTVDKTAPMVTISGIESNQYYEEAEKEVIVVCDDSNISVDQLKVIYGDKELTKNDYQMNESTAGSVEIKLSLAADGNDKDRTFKVSITDKAGNVNEGGEVNGFRLSASWIARVLHYQLPLVIGIGAALILIIGVMIFLITKKRRKSAE